MIGTRRWLHRIAGLIVDYNAVTKGRVGRRVGRRAASKATGRMLGNLAN